jgi:hypothetical protein
MLNGLLYGEETGHVYALIVGESTYTKGFQSLLEVHNDVRALKNLCEKQGFFVHVLEDVPSSQLRTSIQEFFDIYGADSSAQLFCYFIGNGITIDGTGYFIPTDTPRPEQSETEFLKKAISMSEFDRWSQQLMCKSIFFLFDSGCFDSHYQTTSVEDTRARQWIISGNKGTDIELYGLFRKYVEKAFSAAAVDGLIRASALSSYLCTTISEVTNGSMQPVYGTFGGSGDFTVDLNVPPTGSIVVLSNISGHIFVDGVDKGFIHAQKLHYIFGISPGTKTIDISAENGAVFRLKDTVTVKARTIATVSLSISYIVRPPLVIDDFYAQWEF